MMRVCNLDTCPVGVATQNPELRKNFRGKPEYVANFMKFIAQELREYMARLGVHTVDEMVGRTDLLRQSKEASEAEPHRGKINLSAILNNPYAGNGQKVTFDPKAVYNFELEKTLDEKVLLKKCGKAITKGDAGSKLSMFVMGLGNLAHKQIVKGILILAEEIAYLLFMIEGGINNLYHLITLGGRAQEEVWNEAKGIYEYTGGDMTILFLLYGVATIFITVLFFMIWRVNMKSAYEVECRAKEGKHINTIKEDLEALVDKRLHWTLLTLPILGIVIFTILPLVFMICMAFTSYSKVGDHLTIFLWVGLKNFSTVLGMGNSIGKTFWSVLGWTLIWAVLATFLNYILGMILAIVINRKTTRIKGFWRFCFMLSAAIPQFVSLLLMRTMLKDNGLINNLLVQAGLISSPLPFLTNATWARATGVSINLWVGIPFTMMQGTGILQNIPGELYEAARVDGAGPVTIFFKITLPYMLFVTTPYLITTFTGNINNFNVIYLLTAGAPVPVGATAGKTDLLVTWLYKLTVDLQYFNVGAVVGILTFVILAVVSLITYRNTGSYKNEEGFQ